MSRLPAIQTKTASGKAKSLLEAVQAKLQMTPNLTRVMANSPAVLEGYLSLNAALAEGSLPAKLREALALEVAQRNECQYCLSAHTALGKMAGLTDAEITEAREGRSSSPKHAAALAFARCVLDNRGRVTDDEFYAVRQAGFSHGEIAEIIAHVAINIFTNYFNTATQVEIDFPKIELRNVA